ncbi:MAG: HAMP domain-containing histidine kinase [Clostridiales Family XIII bacterium]|nr:HAMP domain-containing histidine kinase [Clostridiales Family XIII bacterium]
MKSNKPDWDIHNPAAIGAKNTRHRQLRRSLSMSLVLRVLAETAILILSLGLLYLFARFVASFWIWHGDELLYQIYFHFFKYNIFFTLLFGFGLCFFIALIHAWRITLGYIEVMLDATVQTNDDDDNLIELPNQLREVELQLNSIKMQARENERNARDSEQRKNDLVVYLAHDLKTPLTSVIGYLSLLTEEQQISEPLREKYLSIALEKSERLEDLINEFFEITRFNLSTLTLEPSRVNLTRMLEQMVFEFSPMLAEKNLTCHLEVASDIMIKLDVGKMQRVFDNLLRNAISYSYAGSEIHIFVHADEANLSIRFVNHGDTIPEEKLSRIFEQFYRLDSSRASRSGNAGLGLAIAKEIVELHRGTIEAISADDTIIFEVHIPTVL